MLFKEYMKIKIGNSPVFFKYMLGKYAGLDTLDLDLYPNGFMEIVDKEISSFRSSTEDKVIEYYKSHKKVDNSYEEVPYLGSLDISDLNGKRLNRKGLTILVEDKTLKGVLYK